MKLSRIAVGLSAVGLLAVAAPTFAMPALTFVTAANGTQTVDPFGGFDYISNATAVSTAPVFDGTTIITTTYLASANAILDKDGNVQFTPGLVPPVQPNGFEFTVKATIFETATCTIPGPGGTCVQAAFVTVGGSYDIYYDSTADANRNLGSGYLDGTHVIGGNILPGVAGSFILNGTGGGSGNFSFFGDVTFTQTDNTKDAYIAPYPLTGTTAGAEIKIGNATTSWTAPTSWVDGGGFARNGLIFQADGNQSFRVPEPGTLALLGLGLIGAVVGARRRSV